MYPEDTTESELGYASSVSGMRMATAAVFGFLVLSILPVAMALLSGRAAAGASAGFAEPLQNIVHIALFFTVGFVAALQPRPVVVALPVSFVLMLAIGALTDISMAQLVGARVTLFAAVLLFAICISVAYSRIFLISASIASAIAYFLGTRYMLAAPDVASLGYFLAGVCAGASMVAACGVSVGVVVRGYAPVIMPWLESRPWFTRIMALLP